MRPGAEGAVELKNECTYVGVGSCGEKMLEVVALVDEFRRLREFERVDVGFGNQL